MSEELRKKKEERGPLTRSEECKVKSEEWLAHRLSLRTLRDIRDSVIPATGVPGRQLVGCWGGKAGIQQFSIPTPVIPAKAGIQQINIHAPVIPAKAGIQQFTIHGVDSALMSEERRKKKEERSLPRPALARSL